MEFELAFRRVDRRWLFAVVLVAVTHLLLQSFLLPYGNALRSLLPENEPAESIGYDTRSSTTIRNTLTVNASDPFEEDSDEKSFNVDEELDGDITEIGLASQENGLLDDGFSSDSVGIIRKAGDDQIPGPNVNLSSRRSDDGSLETRLQHSETSKLSENISLASQTANSSTTIVPGPKKMRCDTPPKTVTTFQEMNKILVRHRAKSRAPRPLWSSPRDQEILAARAAIERAPVARDEKELYAPIFRNVSTFKKSYEMMERTLKVYVYKEGEKPIFHQPILKGLYASEGWFMKLMEGNKKFSVKDPRKAHLFYMPFSSRMLEFSLYVRNSHNRTNLRNYLRLYSEKIASKYRHWNRTRGADHFLVACHDWAPYETRHHMEQCMKAMCNTDVTGGFKIGRDVSLPETYVRSARDPLRDLGGRPASQRPTLAFYAGNLHGYLRPILLRRWKDDPDMKILGPMPPGVASKMRYIEHMKTSRYCVCPKGYEVNSPRIVEAIFYECVPVILSDNFVPPFFEVLDWEAFSVVVAEKDVPKLKDILLAIPDERYEAMQRAVRRAQRHFLWHAKPVKYDLFHMVLHSIWHNRVFQLKPR